MPHPSQRSMSVLLWDHERLARIAAEVRRISGVDVSLAMALRYALDRAEEALNLPKTERPRYKRPGPVPLDPPVDRGLTGCVESQDAGPTSPQEVHDGA